MNNQLISVIIPTYNGSKTVRFAVRSVINQNIHELEIIVVDDNGRGTEEQRKTAEVLQDLIENNEIKYLIHERNIGGSAARNSGIKESSGSFIAFLDDDDYIYPEKTRIQVECLERNPDAAMCICSGYYVDLNGVGYKKAVNYNDNDFLYKYLLDKIYFNTSAIMFKKKAIEECCGFDETFKRHQDWEIVSRILSMHSACTVNKFEIIRYLEGRNDVKSLCQRINNLEHFFNKCEPYLKRKLSLAQISKIKKYKRRQITQEMIRKGKFIEAFKYGKSYGGQLESVVAGIMIVPLLIRKIVKGSRKVAPRREELDAELN